MRTNKNVSRLVGLLLFTAFFGFHSKVLAQCPTINNPAPSICDASGLSFNDLNAFATDNGNGIVWYDAATGGNAFANTELVQEGTYYADDQSGTCGTREIITVNFIVDPSGQNLDGIFCSNEAPTVQSYIDDVLAPNIPAGGDVNVYVDFALTTLAINTDPLNTTGIFYVVYEDAGGCLSQIEIGNTAIFPSPNEPTPPTTQDLCISGSTTIADLDPGTTDTFNWYANVDLNGNPIPPALNPTTPLVDGTTYYVEASDFFCSSDPVAVLVTLNTPPNAGTSGSLEYCDDSIPTTDFNLFDELTGSPDTTGTWSGPLSTTNGHLGTVNISSLTAGTHVFTYNVASTGACPDENTTVTITIYEELLSGTPSTNNPANFCESNAPTAFDLFSLIVGQDPNGVWTQGTTSADPVVTSPIDISTFTAGTYNFTYNQNLSPNPCPENATTVQVIILPDPNAGLAINAVLCEDDLNANSPFNLFSTLDGSQDNNLGVWTDINGTVVTNPIDITGFTVVDSPYTFTYTIDNGSCSDTENITITIEDASEAGTPTPFEVCEENIAASTPLDLFTQLTGNDAGGTWTDDDGTGALTGSNVDLTLLAAPNTYNFTYTVLGIGSCPDDTATVAITINPQPNTGTATPFVVCADDLAANSPLDLFGQLTGNDAGGSWTDDNATGALSGSDVDLTVLAVGSYNFTYTITTADSCTNASTVTVTVEDVSEAGMPTPFEVCEENIAASTPLDLFTQLTGNDAGGTWTDDDSTGALTGSNVDLTLLAAPNTYSFTYTVLGIGSCPDDTATVAITINPQPNTGTATPFVVCADDAAANSPLDLFGQLTGNDTGGSWTDDNASGALSGSNVDLTVLAVGTYNFTYAITTTDSCSNTSTVTVTIEDASEAGTATPFEICLADIGSSSPLDLFTQLSGNDAGGTWTDDDSSGALSGSNVDLTLLTANTTYNYTYTVLGIGSCSDDTETVSVFINETSAPTANSTQAFCDSASIADLSAMGNTIQWYDDAVGGSPLASTLALVDGENYFASQTEATTNCESSTRVEVTVTINNTPVSGNATNSPINVCNNNTNIDLNTGLDGTQDVGGTWIDTDNTGALTSNIFDATGIAPGTYTFTYFIAGNSPCPDASTAVIVSVENPINAGSDAALDICSDVGTQDLFALLGTADTGGTWSPALASGTNIFDPLVDADGTYTYTVSNACSTASSDVVITLTQAPNAGADATTTLCAVDGTLDLLSVLGGTPDTTGTWSPALASGTNVFDPTVDVSGVYTYTVVATSPCATNASSELTVTVSNSAAPMVIDAELDFCLEDAPTVADLDPAVNGMNIIWYEDNTATTPLAVNTALVDGEDYFATQTDGSGCESSARVTINVNINDAATPTLIDPSLELCINDGLTIQTLNDNINEYNASTNNIVWYDALTDGNIIDPTTLLSSGTTYYAALFDPVTGCESNVRLTFIPDLTGCGTIRFPDGFSPNNDGVNDTYDVDNLGFLFPNFEMEIYNRYGSMVYKGNANSPRFNGKSNKSGSLRKGELPVGVYFYVVTFNDGITKPVQGKFYLNR